MLCTVVFFRLSQALRLSLHLYALPGARTSWKRNIMLILVLLKNRTTLVLEGHGHSSGYLPKKIGVYTTTFRSLFLPPLNNLSIFPQWSARDIPAILLPPDKGQTSKGLMFHLHTFLQGHFEVTLKHKVRLKVCVVF